MRDLVWDPVWDLVWILVPSAFPYMAGAPPPSLNGTGVRSLPLYGRCEARSLSGEEALLPSSGMLCGGPGACTVIPHPPQCMHSLSFVYTSS